MGTRIPNRTTPLVYGTSQPWSGTQKRDHTMSKETLTWLRKNVLVGFTDKRGLAWHGSWDDADSAENHYPGAIPVADVDRKLFGWEAVSRRVAVELPATFENMTHLSDEGAPMRWTVQEDRQAIASDDTHAVMGLFKSGYQAHQYSEWLVGNVSNILGDTLSISSAGLLKGRAVAWVEISVPDNIRTPQGVEFRPNLLATTSFDGTVATTYKRTSTLTVCDNTLAMALSEKGQTYKRKHTRNSAGKLEQDKAREALAIIHDYADATQTAIETLCSIEVTRAQFDTIVANLTAPTLKAGETEPSKRAATMSDKKSGEVRALYQNDNRVAPWAGTAFGVVQAFNTWNHHLKGANSGTIRTERNMLDAISGATGKADDTTWAEIVKVLELNTVSV